MAAAARRRIGTVRWSRSPDRLARGAGAAARADRRRHLRPGDAGRLQRRAATDITWLDADSYLVSAARRTAAYEWLKVDAASGRTTPLFDATRMETALAALPGVTAPKRRDRALARTSTFNADAHRRARHDRRRPLLLRLRGRASVAPDDDARRRRGGDLQPDGRLVAFVRAQQPVRRRRRRRARARADERRRAPRSSTASSTGSIRRRSTAAAASARYWWSPDSARLAFLQLDERPVPEYTVVDHIPVPPRARGHRLSEGRRSESDGEARRVARGRRRRRSGSISSSYAATDFLIVNVDWTPDVDARSSTRCRTASRRGST